MKINTKTPSIKTYTLSHFKIGDVCMGEKNEHYYLVVKSEKEKKQLVDLNLSEGTLAKIKRGEPINMKSLNAICCMLRKNVDDVIDIEITDDEKIKYFI